MDDRTKSAFNYIRRYCEQIDDLTTIMSYILRAAENGNISEYAIIQIMAQLQMEIDEANEHIARFATV